MEIDEIVVLVDEVGCQSAVKIRRIIRLFVTYHDYVPEIKLQGYQFCSHSYLNISHIVFDHSACLLRI